jgi:hypothetical protein
MFDFSAPFYSTDFRLIPYGFALNLNGTASIKTPIRENTYATFTDVKGCAFVKRFCIGRKTTWHAYVESSLIRSPFLWHFNHLNVFPLLPIPQYAIYL